MGGKGLLLALALFLPVALATFLFSRGNSPLADVPMMKRDDTSARIFVRTTPVEVTLAQTDEARKRGLSGTLSLPEGRGLLMVFPENARHGIWMKGMRYPIDILWLGEEGEIVHIEESVSPESFPSVFRPSTEARFVLEVPAGFVEIHGISLGDTVRELPALPQTTP